MRIRRALLSASSLSLAIVFPRLAAATDLHFDYTSFDNPNTPGVSPHFGQAQFNVVNYPSINGNYMMTSTDTHRPEMVANNNNLAEFYNNFLADYNTQFNSPGGLNATAEADAINSYTVKNSQKNGPRPDRLLLNEISSSVWQDTTQKGIDYRAWAVAVVTRLNDNYGYNVVTFAPFATVGTVRASDWQALTAKSSVGVENYLSGAEVMAGGTNYASRVAWAQAQYQASVDTYGAAGVPKSKLILTEEFANTVSGTGWGRAGIAASDWDTVIQIRQDAIYNVGFPGFAAYAWGSNGMLITEAEQIQHEYWYRTRLAVPGQQPQWLSDSAINVNGTVIPLSWSEQLNWIGGVPNASGAIANFFRTNTAARTITLDGSRTVGTLTFNSPYGYTISAGTGGTLTLNNAAAAANVLVAQGNHTISAQVALGGNANFSIDFDSLTLSGGLNIAAGKTLTKTGGGTLTISGTQTHGSGATLTNNFGNLVMNSDAGSATSANLTVNANAAVTFNSTQHLAALNVGAGTSVQVGGNGSRVINTGSLAVNSARLDLVDNDLIVRGNSFGSWNGSAYTGVNGLVQSGYAGGDWSGNGVITSQSNAHSPSVLTTLAAAKASDVLGISGSQSDVWHGETVNGNASLVMYTWGGDANLDGTLNGDDYFQIDSHFNQSGLVFGYFNGDFNYDGDIDGDDYFIIDSNWNSGSTSSPMGGLGVPLSAVPEPGGMMVIAVGSIYLRQRRRR